MTDPESLDPAAVTAAELVALIDEYGMLQTDHGRTARIAHEDPQHMPPGRAAVDLETESTLLRFRLGEALVALHGMDPEATEGDLRSFVNLMDGWAYMLWFGSWTVAAGEAINGTTDLDLYRRTAADPVREQWTAKVRALIARRDTRAEAAR
jgi:hypothetical protein